MTAKSGRVIDEEIIEEEEVEEEKPNKRKAGEYEVVLDIEDLAIKEALKDVLAINEEIPKEPHIKDPELAEFFNFKQICETLMELLKPYLSHDQDINILSEDFDLRKAMQLAKKIVGISNSEEEVIEGEPSSYAQELFRKIWQKYIDCKWFFAMMKGKRPVTHKDLKFAKAPEELLKISGEKI
jgi:hypothetical protein